MKRGAPLERRISTAYLSTSEATRMQTLLLASTMDTLQLIVVIGEHHLAV